MPGWCSTQINRKNAGTCTRTDDTKPARPRPHQEALPRLETPSSLAPSKLKMSRTCALGQTPGRRRTCAAGRLDDPPSSAKTMRSAIARRSYPWGDDEHRHAGSQFQDDVETSRTISWVKGRP